MRNIRKWVRHAFAAVVLGLGVMTALPPQALAERPQAGPGHGHHDFPSDVAQFHAVMAPLWHAAEGADRAARACDQIGRLSDGAAAIQAGPAPRVVSDASQWAEASAHLAGRVAALDAACQTPGRTGFVDALTEVHEAFHGLVRFLGHHH